MARTNTKDRNTNENREAKIPNLIAYYVTGRREDKSYWTRVGAAWNHEDGKGFTAQLDLIPVGEGRIVFRLPTEPEA